MGGIGAPGAAQAILGFASVPGTFCVEMCDVFLAGMINVMGREAIGSTFWKIVIFWNCQHLPGNDPTGLDVRYQY